MARRSCRAVQATEFKRTQCHPHCPPKDTGHRRFWAAWCDDECGYTEETETRAQARLLSADHNEQFHDQRKREAAPTVSKTDKPTLCWAKNPVDPEVRCIWSKGHGPVSDPTGDLEGLFEHGDPTVGDFWNGEAKKPKKAKKPKRCKAEYGAYAGTSMVRCKHPRGHGNVYVDGRTYSHSADVPENDARPKQEVFWASGSLFTPTYYKTRGPLSKPAMVATAPQYTAPSFVERPTDALATIHLSIGNSDGRLSQHAWSMYCARIDTAVRDYSQDVFGEFYSEPSSQYQSACWSFNVPNMLARERLTFDLRTIVKEFEQESIAWNESPTTFVKP